MSPQHDLFSQAEEPVETDAVRKPIADVPGNLSAESKLSAAFGPYQTYMQGKGLSLNTVKAFLGDIRLLDRYFKELDETPSLGEIGTDDLNRFLYWLRFDRTDESGEHIPCSPKSYTRRVTSIKAFFLWLTEQGVLDRDPAAPVLQESAQAPLPHILNDDEIERLVRMTRDMLWSPTKPDARPHLLVLMLLQTGMKKSEMVSLELDDIDLSNPREPVVIIRYAESRNAHKERKLQLGPAIPPVLNQYLRAYKPATHLFECTARNLEYVLTDAGTAAKLDQVSFEMMRWTSAVRAYRFGTPPETLRLKLGLSPITWRDTFEKIKKLAGPGF